MTQILIKIKKKALNATETRSYKAGDINFFFKVSFVITGFFLCHINVLQS